MNALNNKITVKTEACSGKHPKIGLRIIDPRNAQIGKDSEIMADFVYPNPISLK